MPAELQQNTERFSACSRQVRRVSLPEIARNEVEQPRETVVNESRVLYQVPG